MADGDGTVGSALFVLSVLAILCNSVSVLCKLCQQYINPKLWKYALFYQNIAHIWTCVGLILYWVNIKVPKVLICDLAGFFILYGIIESALSFLNTGVILLSIQNPGKSDSISNYHRNIFLVVILPEVVFGAILCFLPYVSDSVVDSSVEFDVDCLAVVDHGKSGAAYGTLVFVLVWIILAITVICDVLIILKLWKFNNRIDLSPNNVWQTQLVWHGKRLAVISTLEHFLFLCICVIATVSIYSESSVLSNHKTWVVMTSVAIATLLHGILSNVGDVMWGTCCCRTKNAVQEPHRKLKKLDLVKIEAPGKLRMKATWSVGKHASKRGLMKIYGVNHLKSWAQEIVMLGMMRKAQHPSLIQCLWTNSSNPYYETMTLISGEIVTSDSRIICLEMTNGGTLEDFLQKAELPLPEPCQRMIIHDIAEGLFYLHHENILHNNLNSSCIYLKGSLQSMVLRAAVGDFEDAELYGTLQQSLDDSLRDKRYFFLPDIRSFALVALEIVSKMCVKKFQNRYINYNSDQVPLKINLESMISDDEDEFEEQYCYDIEDTHRMFECVQSDSDDNEDNAYHMGQRNQGTRSSLDNLLDKDRPLSPNYTGISGREAGIGGERPYCVEISGDEDDEEVMAYNDVSENNKKHTQSSSAKVPIELKRCKSPEMPTSQISKVSSRKSRKDTSKSADRALNLNRMKSPHSRSLSPKALEQRCTSPDPMMDEKLQELRKETKAGKQSKKQRKFSFNRKRSEENVLQKNGQAFEAFVSNGDKNSKKKDGNWLSKPTSILKTIAGNESTVSVFKAKSIDEDSHLDAIEEEDIDSKTYKSGKIRTPKVKEKKEKPINEVWDIIDEQYYSQVNRKAMNKLKKTISGESRSSLWSFISTPEDLDDDDLDDILDSLPGMADNYDLSNGKVTIQDILAEKDNAFRKDEAKKRFSYKDLSKTRFELIDYYELLKSRKIQIEDVPEDKREMLLNVVELKLEEKLRREGKVRTTMDSIIEDGGAIRSDELYDNGMNPEGSGMNCYGSPGNKSKMVSFRQTPCHASSSPQRKPTELERDPRQDRSRSAPLKRTRTPIQKTKTEMKEKQLEQNPVFTETKPFVAGAAKRTRARSALKRALNNKGPQQMFRNDRERTPTGEKQDLTLKYATVRKINVKNAEKETEQINVEKSEEMITVPVPTSESFSVTKVKQAPTYIDNRVRRYPSFSSNESGSSIASSVRLPKPADVSLTSGEVSSLSSQAESEHYETDGHLTDIEGPSSSSNIRRYKSRPGPPSRVDSGIDSGSVSSEMSDAMYNRSKQNSFANQNAPKGALNSWARNYKTVDSIPASPYNFSNKFLPPFNSLPEESASAEGSLVHIKGTDSKYYDEHTDRDTDSAVSVSTSNVSSSRMIAVTESRNKGTLNLMNRPMSPETTSDRYSKKEKLKMKSASRPMSPLNNPVRPSDRPMSPMGRPLSPKVRPTHVKRTKSTTKRQQHGVPSDRPMSPESRPMSPFNKPVYNSKTRTLSPDSRPMSPNSNTMMQQTGASRTDVSPSRALSPIERVDSHTKLRQQREKQYPKQVKPTKEHSVPQPTPIINVESSDMSGTGGGQEKSNQASRRYRELVKQGVPLRASVVEASPTRQSETNGRDGSCSRPGTAESTLEEPMDDQQLFDDLESKGFFATRGRSPKRHGASPNRSVSPQTNQKDTSNNKSDTLKKRKRKKIPLEELVRENPSNGVTAHRSPSKNHLIVSEDAFLNQPTSEDSETCSIKTNKSTNSSPSGSKPKVVVDAELVIDRIFSQNHPQDYDIDVEVEAALGLDKNPLKQIKKMYKESEVPSNDVPNLDNIPLLNGVSQRHIHECLELASSLQVIAVRDLLPATKDGYDILSNKLMQIGQLGSVGTQLLDIIEKCWLHDMPPTSGTLVEQLTDPVTETEL